MPNAGAPTAPIYTPETYTPAGSIGRLVAGAAAMLSRAIDRRAHEVSLTGPQWMMLMRIGHGMGSTEMCRTIGNDLSRTSVSEPRQRHH